jgi:hypothetical protein
MVSSTRALAVVLIGCGLGVGSLSPAQAEPEIGAVFQRPYLGAAGARVDGAPEPLYFNTTVYADETVATTSGGSTAIEFHDGTRLQVGASSTVVLDSFVYDPDSGGAEAVLSFSKGVFRFVSGSIPKENLRLETPSASLTIRGTAFVLAVDEAGNTDVWVVEGAVEATPREGAPATARAGQSLVVVLGTPGVTVLDRRTGPLDPAVENDLTRFGPAGGGNGGHPSPSGSQGGDSGDSRDGGKKQ